MIDLQKSLGLSFVTFLHSKMTSETDAIITFVMVSAH